MADEIERGLVREWWGGIAVGAVAMLGVVFVLWTLLSVADLRNDVAAMKVWTRTPTLPPVAPPALREQAADDLAAARVAEVLADSGSAVDGCSTGASPGSTRVGDSVAPRGESVDALEWLQRAREG